MMAAKLHNFDNEKALCGLICSGVAYPATNTYRYETQLAPLTYPNARSSTQLMQKRGSADCSQCATGSVRAICTFAQTIANRRPERAEADVACAGIAAQESVPLLLSKSGPPLHKGLLHGVLICMCRLR